jgi:RHS repeat-associated protein
MNRIYSVNANTASEEDNFYANGLLVASRNGTSVSYYQEDALGSVRLASDSGGSQTYSSNYRPFGTSYGVTGSSPMEYAGKPPDAAIGLYYFASRWYDASTGRFITEDSHKGNAEDPLTLNRYAYARDNPLGITDPPYWPNLQTMLSRVFSNQQPRIIPDRLQLVLGFEGILILRSCVRDYPWQNIGDFGIDTTSSRFHLDRVVGYFLLWIVYEIPRCFPDYSEICRDTSENLANFGSMVPIRDCNSDTVREYLQLNCQLTLRTVELDMVDLDSLRGIDGHCRQFRWVQFEGLQPSVELQQSGSNLPHLVWIGLSLKRREIISRSKNPLGFLHAWKTRDRLVARHVVRHLRNTFTTRIKGPKQTLSINNTSSPRPIPRSRFRNQRFGVPTTLTDFPRPLS